MTVERLRKFCLSLRGTTEDVKWGQDLAFSIGGKMYAVVNLEPPHQLSFKCTPESFGELVEREGLIPAPYLARAMWVQEERLGDALEPREREALLRMSYELVLAKLPKKKRQLASASPARRPEISKRP
jgi:predicted DNA-binding protein (MmcQ/YjbR family)